MTAMECGHGVAQRVRYGVGGVVSDSFFKPDPRFGMPLISSFRTRMIAPGGSRVGSENNQSSQGFCDPEDYGKIP